MLPSIAIASRRLAFGAAILASTASSAAAGEDVTIGGTVADETGEPIPGARVCLYCDGFDSDRRLHFGRIDVLTDERGKWTGEVPEFALRWAQSVHIRLYHPDHVCHALGYAAPPIEQLYDGTSTMVMTPGRHFSGTVLDDKGHPIANALILSQPHNVDFSELDRDPTTTRSASDGTFEFRNLPSGRAMLAVYAEGFAPQRVPINTRTQQSGAVRLTPAFPVSGVVVDEANGALAEVHVRFKWEFPLRADLATDQNGRFETMGLPQDDLLTVHLAKKGYLPTAYDLVSIQDDLQRLVIYSPPTIRGRVLDAHTAQPIEQFEVVEGRKSSAVERLTFSYSRPHPVSSADGHFEHTILFTARPPDPAVALRIIAQGYIPEETPVIVPGQHPEPFTLRLKPAPPITGTVVAPDGQPISKCEVAWIGPNDKVTVDDGRLRSAEFLVHTDVEGQFELPPQKRDGWLVAIHSKGYAWKRAGEHDPESPLGLVSWSRVEGRGIPALDGRNVVIRPAGADALGRVGPVKWWFHKRARPDGRFSFDKVPALPLRMGYPVVDLLSHSVEVTPQPGETASVNLAPEGITLEGKIELPEPLDGIEFSSSLSNDDYCALVVAFPSAQSDRPRTERHNHVAQLSPDGGFRIEGLAPDRYHVVVTISPPAPENGCGLPVATAQAATDVNLTSIPIRITRRLPPLRPEILEAPGLGELVADFEATTTAGQPFKLGAYRGKPVVLDFWATWCVPCLKAMPEVRRLYKKYGEDGSVEFVSINLDLNQTTAAAYVRDAELTWTQVLAGEWGENNPILRSFSITSIPSYWIVGPDGTILARETELSSLEAALERIARNENPE